MSDPTPALLRRPFNGYHWTLDREPDRELTEVAKGTPAGEYLRRFWQPVALTAQVGERPLAVRILGQDLVLYRDGDGRLGLLNRACSHRNTSLEFGRIERRGLRCAYHGWLFDTDGTVLETPGEPEDSKIRRSYCHGAFPTHEFADIVFGYFGPPDSVPAFPHLDSFEREGDRLVPYSLHSPCNWLQVRENAYDPFHSVFLHARVNGIQFAGLDKFGELPLIAGFERPFGSFYTNTRRIGDHVWVRRHDQFLPNIAQNGGLRVDTGREEHFGFPSVTSWVVPVDETNTRYFGWRHVNRQDFPDGDPEEGSIGLDRVDFYGQTGDRPYEEMQRNTGDWEAWVSQGPVSIHANERLGTTDRLISAFRRRLRTAIRRLRDEGTVARPEPRDGQPIPTLAGDTVLRIPRTNGDEREHLLAISQAVAEAFFAADHLSGDERRDAIARRLHDVSTGPVPVRPETRRG